jgi:Carbohydrate family 9 binding domain-like/Beta-galactosidase
MVSRFEWLIERCRRTVAASILVTLFALSSFAGAGVLIDEDFDAVPDGEKPAAAHTAGTLICWEGDAPGQLGKVAVTSTQHAGPKGKALSIARATPSTTRGPVLDGHWTAPTAGVVQVQWQFMTPASDISSMTFIGGIWPEAAAIFIVEGGKFRVQDAAGDQDRSLIAPAYNANQWYIARCDLNTAKRTFDFYLDDHLVLRNRPFQSGNKSIGTFHVTGDLSTVKRDPTVPVLYIDGVFVASAPTAQSLPATRPARVRSITPQKAGLDLYSPREQIAWNIALAGDVTGTQLVWQVRDWNEVAYVGAPMGAGPEPVRLVYAPDRCGWFELSVALQDARGNTVDEQRRCFSVESAAKSSGRYMRYGVCSHTPDRTSGPELEKEVELMAALGIDIVRNDLYWGQIQPDGGTWDYHRFDNYLTALESHGIEVDAVLGYSPQWASTAEAGSSYEIWANKAPRLDAYLAYVRKSVERYKGRMRYWEIWNEPDIAFWKSSTEEYLQLFSAASREIKQTNPQALVLNGGFAMVSRAPNPDFLEVFPKAADKSNWDIWVYHDYLTFADMFVRNDLSRRLSQSAGLSLPVWVNETGYLSMWPGEERTEAITLVKKYAMAPALGIAAYLWYDLRDDGLDANDPEHHFGLVHNNYQPKPAYPAYQRVIRELAGRRFVARLTDVPDGTYAVVYAGEGADAEHVMVLWREGKGRTTPLWVSCAGSVNWACDVMGNDVNTVPYAAGAIVSVGDAPIYVHLRSNELTAQVRPVVSLPERLVLIPDVPGELAIQVSNPTAVEARLSLSLRSDMSQVRLTPAEADLTIAPGQTATYRARAEQKAGEPAAYGKIKVQLTDRESKKTLYATVAAATAMPVPHLTSPSATQIPAGEGLRLILDSRESIHNLFEADPTANMKWGGAQDLSATARLACDASGLLVEVVAQDDVHCQESRGEKIWSGDCLQVAIDASESGRDYLEAGIALLADGTGDGWIYHKPTASKITLGQMGAQFPALVSREGTYTTYRLKVPWASLGLASAPAAGFRFSFIVNDNDGKGRKQWVQLTPGIGETKDPSQYRVFVCR